MHTPRIASEEQISHLPGAVLFSGASNGIDMRRPSFQFYPDDWSANSNLKRCTHEEKGIWIDVMCILHDQEEYGVARWPLADIAQAVGTTPAKVKRLVAKGVLKGVDTGKSCDGLMFTPRSGRKDGDPVVLIEQQEGPLWYSSRMVLDEYKRKVRGGSIDPSTDTPNPAPKVGIGEGMGGAPKDTPMDAPDPSPSRAGASSSSSSASSLKETTPNPSLLEGEKPDPEKPKRNRLPRIQLKTFIEVCKRKGEKPISEYQPLLDYVEKTGLPMEYIQLAWEVFKDEHLDPGANHTRMKADWRRHFLNYIQKGYYRLWYAKPDGTFEMTTAGYQARSYAEGGSVA